MCTCVRVCTLHVCCLILQICRPASSPTLYRLKSGFIIACARISGLCLWSAPWFFGFLFISLQLRGNCEREAIAVCSDCRQGNTLSSFVSSVGFWLISWQKEKDMFPSLWNLKKWRGDNIYQPFFLFFFFF